MLQSMPLYADIGSLQAPLFPSAFVFVFRMKMVIFEFEENLSVGWMVHWIGDKTGEVIWSDVGWADSPNGTVSADKSRIRGLWSILNDYLAIRFWPTRSRLLLCWLHVYQLRTKPVNLNFESIMHVCDRSQDSTKSNSNGWASEANRCRLLKVLSVEPGWVYWPSIPYSPRGLWYAILDLNGLWSEEQSVGIGMDPVLQAFRWITHPTEKPG